MFDSHVQIDEKKVTFLWKYDVTLYENISKTDSLQNKKMIGFKSFIHYMNSNESFENLANVAT